LWRHQKKAGQHLNYDSLDAELKLLSLTPGVIACVLVGADTGMIYLSTSKSTKVETIAEAARDYWALHSKNGKLFDPLGSVQHVFIQHSRAVLSIQMFGKAAILLVTIAKLKGVDWNTWPTVTHSIKKLLLQIDSPKFL
jgi:hypothetical protein